MSDTPDTETRAWELRPRHLVGRERSLLNLTHRWMRGDPHPRHKPKPYWNEEWLRREFIEKGRTGSDIAGEFGVNFTAVYFWLRKFGFSRPARRPKQAGPDKLCRRCGMCLPLSRFRKRQKKRPDGSVVVYHHSQCRECDTAESVAYKKSNRKMASASEKRRYRNRVAEMSPEEYRAKILLPRSRYVKKNPARASLTRRAAEQRRRCRETGGLGVSAIDIERVRVGQKNCCWWCGKKLRPGWHVDHRIPLSKGGEHSPSNIVIACPTCNVRKHAMMPWDFAGRLL